MLPIKSKDLIHRIAGVIWGDAKTGKTTWAASLPGKKLFINFDPDGFISIADRDDFSVIDLSSLPPLTAIEEAKKAAAFLLTPEADEFTSVVFDSLTTFATVATRVAVEKGYGKSTAFTPTMEAPGLAAYGARNTIMDDVIDRFLRASGQKKKHLFFIAHADDPVYSDDGKVALYQTIMLTGKVRNGTNLRVSEIYYLATASGNRRMVYLAPFGILKPMGSRMFDTSKLDRFELKYDPNLSDEEQPHSLARIINQFFSNGCAKMTQLPK